MEYKCNVNISKMRLTIDFLHSCYVIVAKPERGLVPRVDRVHQRVLVIRVIQTQRVAQLVSGHNE